ncbi:regulatory protein RecX [Paenibacillus sp. GCM10027627]|uniref:regulatory protein RecX n=1 Tax=unclassified Paenibacillus TaxID=185978 RepID=UPI00363A46D2
MASPLSLRAAKLFLQEGMAGLKDEELEAYGEGWTIEAVRRDKKEKRTYLIFADLEAELPQIAVHEDIMIRFRLMKGQFVTIRQAEEIRMENSRYLAYAQAVAYLGAKPRTSKAIAQYLARKEFEEESIQYAVQRLESEQLVDDEQYARQFAASRMQSGLKGRLMIKQELQQRGVPKGIAAEALSGLDRGSELQAAIKLAEKKCRSVKGEAKQKRMKLMAFLLRRGFPGDIVREAIKGLDLRSAEQSDEEDDGVLLDN